MVVARELTKIHEEVLRGTADEIRESLIMRDAIRGEFVVMIGKADAPQAPDVPIEVTIETLIGAGIDRMEAIKTVARERGLSKREVYKLISGPRGPKRMAPRS
jgi:16S rRNA (cytidine1402-2'-O)-methyltransferase